MQTLTHNQELIRRLKLIRALKDCLIVMEQAGAGDTVAAKLACEALEAVGEKPERAVLNYIAA